MFILCVKRAWIEDSVQTIKDYETSGEKQALNTD